MTYDARQIANWFVSRARSASRTLSIMQLLKLVYIAHGWHLEITKRPLFNNGIQAWRFGPVIPDVYNAFRNQGINVDCEVASTTLPIHANDEKLLGQIWDIYGSLSAFQLSELTHEDGGPWDVASKLRGNYAPIPDELIQKHYELKRLQAKQLEHG